MYRKIIRSTYYITLVLFCGIISVIAFSSMVIIPQAKRIIEQLGYPHYFLKYIGIYFLIAAGSWWLVPLKMIKHFIYAGFFILLVSAIFSYIKASDSWSFMFLLLSLLILLGFNYYCFYKTEIKKHKFLMYVIHKKIKDNDASEEIGFHCSDAG